MQDILEGLSEEEKIEVISFGIKRGKILLFSGAGILLLGCLFNVVRESMVFLLALYSLRIYAGGYHAKTQTRCLALSIIIVSIGFGSIKYFSGRGNNILFFGALIAGALIWKLAPVENQNKLLDNREKREYGIKARKVLLCQCLVILIAYHLQFTKIFMGIVMAMIIVGVGVLGGKVQNEHIK